MNWKPIETAPKDGSTVLLHYRDWLGNRDMIVTGEWDSLCDGYDINDTWKHSFGYGDADHWMPLPEPPKGDE